MTRAKFIAAIFRFLPHVLTDKYRRLGLRGQHDAVARPRINLDDLRMNLVLRLQDDAGEVSVAAQGIDDDPFNFDVKGVEDEANKLVRQRPLIVFTTHGHGNGTANTRLDVNHEAFLLVADKDGQSVLIGGEYPKNLNPHYVRILV